MPVVLVRGKFGAVDKLRFFYTKQWGYGTIKENGCGAENDGSSAWRATKNALCNDGNFNA